MRIYNSNLIDCISSNLGLYSVVQNKLDTFKTQISHKCDNTMDLFKIFTNHDIMQGCGESGTKLMLKY